MIFFEFFIQLIVFSGVLFALRKGVLSPHFLVSLHLFFGINLRYLYLTMSENPEKLLPSLPIASETFLELFIFIFLYFIFYYVLIISRLFINTSESNSIFRLNKITKQRLRKLIFITISFLFTFYYLMIVNIGSIELLINAFQNRVSTNIKGLNYIMTLHDFAMVGSIFIFYFSRKINEYKLLSNILVTVMIFSLIILGGRGNIIQYIISIAIVVGSIKGTRIYFEKSLLILILLFVILSTLGLAARKANQLDIPLAEAYTQAAHDFVGALSSPFALFDHYELSKRFTSIHGHDYGLFYLEQLTRPIPRKIWPEKPEVLGKKIRLEFWGDASGGVPAGIIGESYISFGFIGFIIIGFILALIVVVLEHSYTKSLIDDRITVIIALIVPYVMFNLIRTGFDTAFTRIALMLTTYFFFAFISKYKF